MKYYSAQSIIPKFIEFKRMTPHTKKWNLKELEKNLPRLIRYKRLMALLKAFNINCSLEEFKGGDFLYDKKWSKQIKFREKFHTNKFIINELSNFADKNEKYKTRVKERGLDFYLLWMYFWGLADAIYSVKDISQIKIGNPTGAFYLSILENFKISENFETIGKVHRILGVMIDPSESEVSEYSLIHNFGYPDVDLDEIDGEWY
jgi:hypothetical protein